MLTNSPLEEQFRINDFCHSKGIKFIVCDTKGLFGQIFCDFGKKFTVFDTNGESVQSVMISAVTKNVSIVFLLPSMNKIIEIYCLMLHTCHLWSLPH